MNPLVPVLFLALAACSPMAVADPPPADGVVARIADGDTVALADGTKIRIKGLNAPETHNPHLRNPDGTETVQCWGPQATDYARAALLHQHVRLVTDPGDLYDRYGRLVAEIWTDDGRSYAAEAVRAGEGRAYLFNKRHPASNWADIEAAEREAQVAGRGMWSCPT